MYRTFQDLVFGHIEQDARISELEKRVFRVRSENNDKFIMLEDFMNKYYMEQQINQIKGTPIEQVYSDKFEVDKETPITSPEEDKFTITEVYTIGNTMALINTERKTGEIMEDNGVSVPTYDRTSHLLKFNEETREVIFIEITKYLTDIYLILNDKGDKILFIVTPKVAKSYNIYQLNYLDNTITDPTTITLTNTDTPHTQFTYTYIEKSSIGTNQDSATNIILQSNQDTVNETYNLEFSVYNSSGTITASIAVTTFNRTIRYIDFDNYIAIELGSAGNSDTLLYNTKTIDNKSSVDIVSFEDLKLFVNKEPYIDTYGTEFEKDSIFMYDAGYYNDGTTIHGTNNIYILHPSGETYKLCDVVISFEYSGTKAISGVSGQTVINNSNAIISNNCGLIMDNIALFRYVNRNQYIPAGVKLYSHNSDFFFSAVAADKAALIKIEQSIYELANREDTVQQNYIITNTVNGYEFKYDIVSKDSNPYIVRQVEKLEDIDVIYICGKSYRIHNNKATDGTITYYILYVISGSTTDDCESLTITAFEDNGVTKYQVPITISGNKATIFGTNGIKFDVKEGKTEEPTTDTNPYHYITPFVVNRIDSSEIGKVLTKEDAAESIYTLFGEKGYLINKIQPN